jgi:serine phosphatase RsbU (regulator of sigma subunit)
MRTHTKIMILIIVTIGTIVGVILGYQYIKIHQEKIFIKATIDAKNQVIENILNFKAKSYLSPVNDYSCWDEMVDYIQHPTQRWEEINLTTLKTFGFTNSWILNNDLKEIYSIKDSTWHSDKLELSREIISESFKNKGVCHFFLIENDTLLEVSGGTIVPSADVNHLSKAQGYFFAAKHWNKDYIRELEREMDLSISFRFPKDTAKIIQPKNGKLTISKEFKDVFGNCVLIADFTIKNKLFQDFYSTDKLSYFLIGLLIFTVFIFSFAIRTWVTHPLKLIAKSLENENESYVLKLEKNTDEFGEIALLIKNFQAQKIQLEYEIAEHIETQKTVHEYYNDTVNLNHELQASEEELRQSLDVTMEMNEALSKQQVEITDSINYACRIQSALLPPFEAIEVLLQDFFILYKPRNIVSGDFYWVTQKNNKTIVCIADCTGHGVPGGFMSMLGMAYLADVVNLSEEQTTGEILDQLRKRIIDSLHQSGKSGETIDGMDIALCIIDFETFKLQFSGAYNPLYIIRNINSTEDSSSHELIEIKGDRMPIGYSFRMDNPFTTHHFNLQKNDIIYLFTDGLQDQLSSITLGKFKPTKLRELLLSIHNLELEAQKRIIEETFDEYRHGYPQIDDVLVFGTRI